MPTAHRLEPTTQSLQLRCGACRKIFEGDALTNVPVEVAVKSMMLLRCPECGSKRILMGQSRTAAEDDACRGVPTDAPVAERAQDWLRTGEIGNSAKAIFEHMTGGRSHGAVPHDVGDLHRCMLLLRRIPEWIPWMTKMDVHPGWEGIAREWRDLLRTFREEAGADFATWPRPLTGKLLEKLTEGVR